MTLASKPIISLVKYPILTEKTIQLLQSNQYSFAVDKNATKVSIKTAIELTISEFYDTLLTDKEFQEPETGNLFFPASTSSDQKVSLVIAHPFWTLVVFLAPPFYD